MLSWNYKLLAYLQTYPKHSVLLAHSFLQNIRTKRTFYLLPLFASYPCHSLPHIKVEKMSKAWDFLSLITHWNNAMREGQHQCKKYMLCYSVSSVYLSPWECGKMQNANGMVSCKRWWEIKKSRITYRNHCERQKQADLIYDLIRKVMTCLTPSSDLLIVDEFGLRVS